MNLKNKSYGDLPGVLIMLHKKWLFPQGDTWEKYSSVKHKKIKLIGIVLRPGWNPSHLNSPLGKVPDHWRGVGWHMMAQCGWKNPPFCCHFHQASTGGRFWDCILSKPVALGVPWTGSMQSLWATDTTVEGAGWVYVPCILFSVGNEFQV